MLVCFAVVICRSVESHCVSKNDTDVAHSFDGDQPILIRPIIGTDVAETVCYQTVIFCPTFSN